jgi:hypothetical protein
MVRIGVPRVTPPAILLPVNVTPSEAEPLGADDIVKSSAEVEGKVNVEVEGLSVQLR